MTSSKSVSWSALVNIGNNESLALTVSGEAANPDEARDIFAFACGQLLGVANSADEATAPLIRAYVSRLVQTEEARPVEQDAVPATPPSAEEQAAAAVTQCIKPPVDVEDIARQQHADKLKADLERLQADHDTRVARWAATAPDPAPSAPPTPEASTVATAPDAPQSAPTAPPKMGSGAVCEKCGAEVSDAQKNLSQLFTNKTLCKTCLEAP
jgi:hypothetical protein